MKYFLKFLTVILIFSPFLSGQQQEISLSFKPEKKNYLVGDKILFTLTLEYPGQFKVVEPAYIDSLSTRKLEYLSVDTIDNIEKNGRISKGFNLYFSAFDSLDVVVPSFTWLFIKGADTLKRFSGVDTIRIRTVPVNMEEEIKDVKPPEKIPWGWLEYSILFGGILLVGLLVWFIIWKFRKKSKTEKVPEAEPVRIPTNYEKALEMLEAIDAKQYLAHNEVKMHYSEVADTLRWFFNVEYHFPSLELTTRETIRELNKKINGETVAGVDDFLTRADMVKFAKYIPTENESGNYTASAVALLNELNKGRARQPVTSKSSAQSGQLDSSATPAEVSEPVNRAEIKKPAAPAEVSEPVNRAEMKNPAAPAEVAEPVNRAEMKNPAAPAEVAEPKKPEERQQSEAPEQSEEPDV
ncbi:MAG: hypothetical protein LC102_09785 [Ignavibacteriales bacterium]|nr:MAG: hypothetical protein F9K26_01415 [Ignavibacteriaceae bacterium]MBV6446034.1 hypothetical protein [Ignavibacteriaceae bacterium]MBW7872069.1 hypothetical protein [Ignavibacteria bacterium]MCZ2143703.1 hypothetical protein [Ignavibacteriales bacterium]WKZ73662.1 MAG: hypothetical protein QY308_05520 [Ignavibacteriaceae bacterium]